VGVQVQGDVTAKTHDMTRDDKGVWSYTSEPLKPGSYQYWFVMDGLTMPDPVNTYVRPASGVYKSQFDVPGEGVEWMAFRDVPHGTLHRHYYKSEIAGEGRAFVGYSPTVHEEPLVEPFAVDVGHGGALGRIADRHDHERLISLGGQTLYDPNQNQFRDMAITGGAMAGVMALGGALAGGATPAHRSARPRRPVGAPRSARRALPRRDGPAAVTKSPCRSRHRP